MDDELCADEKNVQRMKKDSNIIICEIGQYYKTISFEYELSLTSVFLR